MLGCSLGMEWHPQASSRRLIHNCLCCVCAVLVARGDFKGYWHFILQFQKGLCIKWCHEIASSETWFLISFSSRFRSPARHKWPVDFNEIYNEYEKNPSYIHIPKIISIQKDYFLDCDVDQNGHYFWRGVYIPKSHIWKIHMKLSKTSGNDSRQQTFPMRLYMRVRIV